MTTFGLGLIAISWLLQFLSMVKNRDRRLSVFFLLVYGIGVALLVYGDFKITRTLDIIGALNLVTLLACILVSLRFKK